MKTNTKISRQSRLNKTYDGSWWAGGPSRLAGQARPGQAGAIAKHNTTALVTDTQTVRENRGEENIHRSEKMSIEDFHLRRIVSDDAHH